MNEIWKPVSGAEGYYEVSNLGRIKRVKQGTGLCVAGRIMRPSFSRRGYASYTIRCGHQPKSRFAHVMVAEAFIGPCPDGKEINHIDADRANAALSNLEYVTHSENVRHSVNLGRWHKHGVGLRGEKSGKAKLSDEKVRMILQSDATNTELAQRFGVNGVTISLVRRRKTWTHVVVDVVVVAANKHLRPRPEFCECNCGQRLPLSEHPIRFIFGHDRRKFTDAQIQEIRQSTGTLRELAERFGVCRRAIQFIRQRRTYRDVADARAIEIARQEESTPDAP